MRIMSTHEDDDDHDQEINVDSDSRLSCGQSDNSDVDMDDTGSCYDSETALG